MRKLLYAIRRHLAWVNHLNQKSLDVFTMGLWGYWKSDLILKREQRYGWAA